ncbi:hypothetical protein GCM10027200_05680 [Lentzea nigeriaca]
MVDLPATRPQPLDVVDRPSTPAEQTLFGQSAGSAYTEPLASVNVALSARPMLRTDAKADLVAVCLYLGRGACLDQFDGYLPCLVSGLRRLPTHRKVVLRQMNQHDADKGAILWEPGFLDASTQLDITTAAAGLDLLIWPVSARRTTELLAGRVVEEAVFPAGPRFKVLAVRTREDEGGPQRAFLVRELAKDEDPESVEALARDAAALSRLERAWEQRQRAELRLVEDEDVVARLDRAAVRGRARAGARDVRSGVLGVPRRNSVAEVQSCFFWHAGAFRPLREYESSPRTVQHRRVVAGHAG